MIEAILADVQQGVSVGIISAKFHTHCWKASLPCQTAPARIAWCFPAAVFRTAI